MKTKSFKQVFFNYATKFGPFLLAFFVLVLHLDNSGPLVGISGDATDIWKTIISFNSADIYPSYVLYKGFLSVYPYLWLYHLSLAVGLSEFYLIKIFHCVLFAYISAVGIPNAVKHILGLEKVKIWRICILILLLFWVWVPNLTFTQMMIDLPGLAYFLLMINAAFFVTKEGKISPVVRYLLTGLAIGLNLCLSGQYTPSAILIIIFIMVHTIKKNRNSLDRSNAVSTLERIGLLGVMLLGAAIVKGYDIYFEKSIVDTLRANGAALNTNSEWVKISVFGFIGILRRYFGYKILDYRGIAILNDYYSEGAEAIISQGWNNQMAHPYRDYFNLIFRYPVDFIVRFADRMFVAVSPDGGYMSIRRLFVSFSALYLGVGNWKKRIKTIKDFFSPGILIILAFLVTQLGVMIYGVETRYAMQLQGLLLGLALLDDTIWLGFKKVFLTIKECWKEKSLRPIGKKNFSGKIVGYIFFLIFCFALIAALYDTMNADYSLVFEF